jgi:hypothetical protein
MPSIIDELLGHAMVLASVGRLAAAGHLDGRAPMDDPVAIASQDLLVAAGLLDPSTYAPTELLRDALPAGASLSWFGGRTQEALTFYSRFASGAVAGWNETDPELIRWRGRASGRFVVDKVFAACLIERREAAAQLAGESAAFLDVGVGAAGIAIRMCEIYPHIRVVGLDISEHALAVARSDIKAVGFEERVEIRAASVAEIEDQSEFDMIWLPQLFIPKPVLVAALPRLRAAARPGAMLVLGFAENADDGVLGKAVDIINLMAGGGTLAEGDATALLYDANFADVRRLALPGVSVLTAVAT